MHPRASQPRRHPRPLDDVNEAGLHEGWARQPASEATTSSRYARAASQDCDVRRSAVENLGREGDRRALSAIREAKKQDKGTGNGFSGACLGDRPDEAEKRILASR